MYYTVPRPGREPESIVFHSSGPVPRTCPNLVPTIQDYCITLTTQNSTQINTSRQCMFKAIHVTMDWHLGHRFMVHTKSFIFVSNVVTICVCWLISTLKVITFYIWLPQIEFMPTLFYSHVLPSCCELIGIKPIPLLTPCSFCRKKRSS